MQDSRSFRRFPVQVWIIFAGTLIFCVGSSMAWPYLNIYLREKLNLPLSVTTLLISLRSMTGILTSFLAGTIADKFGRRKMMLFSLIAGSVYYLLMSFAGSMWQFALLMGLWGSLDLFFPVGSNAMVADLVDAEDRIEAYSLLRIVYNAGFAIGPIVGGIIAAHSYQMIFWIAASGYLISFVFMSLKIQETLPNSVSVETRKVNPTRLRDVLQDGAFIMVIMMMVFIYMGTSVVFNLLSLYAREAHAIPENHISIVFTVNALMCVFLQMPIMRATKHLNGYKVMTVAAGFYVIGFLMFGTYANVLWFCLSMVVMTIGELLITPTVLSLTAERAPVDARGRYMSIYNLAHPIGYAFGPVMAGSLYDRYQPRAIWLGATFSALVATGGYLFLFIRDKKQHHSLGK